MVVYLVQGKSCGSSEKVEVFDVRGACCLETAGLGKKLNELPSGEILEVVMDKSMKEMAGKIVERENCEVVEVVDEGEVTHLKTRKKVEEAKGAAERKAEDCMVCGTPLEYLTESAIVTCNYCNKEESSYIRCPRGHYVCEICYGKGAYDAIKDMALSTNSKDPFEIAELMMAHPSVTMLGCDNAYVAAGAFIAALKNEGSLEIGDDQVVEAIDRTKKQAIGGYCALTGVCGVPIAIGAVFSVILKAACPKDRESAITMHAVSRVIDAIANDVGPMCCKSFVRTAMGVGYNLAKEYFNVNLPIHREKISCIYVKRHPHGCRASKCSYFPKRVG